MKIYAQEIQDNLADKILGQKSISYASTIEPCSVGNIPKSYKSIASVDDSDLYYTQSILVSTSWNKNDDIFDRSEVWTARKSPEHKPTNIEHDESQIIGHIIANWPITSEGVLIDENTPIENLPEKYDILTASVIYKSFTNPQLKERSDKLIQEIELGNKFVSMECFFSGFDYGLIDKSSGEYKILARNDNTSFLTKYLRAYGGLGEHENYRIGRVLRNITFSGKGFVNKPANPDSVIFNKDSFKFLENKEKNISFLKKGVLENNQSNINVETEIMPESKTVANENDCSEIQASAEAKIAELSAIIENSKAEFDAALSESKANADSLFAEADRLHNALSQASTEHQATTEKMLASIKELEDKLKVANDSIAGYMKKEKKMMRKASLSDSGFDSSEADEIVEKFDSLDDETFAAMTDMMKKKNKKSKDMMTEETKSSNVDLTEVLENVEEPEQVSLAVGGSDEVDEIETTRAALVDFVRSRLTKKN